MPRIILALVILTPGLAMAYIGPGTGLGAIAAFFALIAGVVLAIVGFLWYPLKRLLKKGDKEVTTESQPIEASQNVEDKMVSQAAPVEKQTS